MTDTNKAKKQRQNKPPHTHKKRAIVNSRKQKKNCERNVIKIDYLIHK